MVKRKILYYRAVRSLFHHFFQFVVLRMNLSGLHLRYLVIREEIESLSLQYLGEGEGFSSVQFSRSVMSDSL